MIRFSEHATYAARSSVVAAATFGFLRYPAL